jgi:hypothetical protein
MALGKIKADTLEHSTAGSLDTQYVVKGSAKVWASFSMSSFATRDSFNSSSLTDNATGDCRINLSSAMSNSNYAVSGTGGDAATSFTGGQRAGGGYCLSTSIVGISFVYQNNGAVDPVLGFGSVLGDLA